MSIKKLIQNIRQYMLFLVLLYILTAAALFNENRCTNTVSLLFQQKALIEAISTSTQSGDELAKIKLKSDVTTFDINMQKLNDSIRHDIFGYILTGMYDRYAQILSSLDRNFKIFAEGYLYAMQAGNALNLSEQKSTILKSLDELHKISHHNSQKRFYIILVLMAFSLATLLLVMIWYVKRLNNAYSDIATLFAVNVDLAKYPFVTDEASIIAKKMVRRSATIEGDDVVDPLTGLNTMDGLKKAFNRSKYIKEANFIGVCVMTIDGIEELTGRYGQQFIDTVLKKLGLIITLSEKNSDIYARITDTLFVVILPRPDKSQAISECESIRHFVEETRFKVPGQPSMQLTLSGGFVTKEGHKTLEDSIEDAKKVLKVTRGYQTNQIGQLRPAK